MIYSGKYRQGFVLHKATRLRLLISIVVHHAHSVFRLKFFSEPAKVSVTFNYHGAFVEFIISAAS